MFETWLALDGGMLEVEKRRGQQVNGDVWPLSMERRPILHMSLQDIFSLSFHYVSVLGETGPGS